MVNAELLTVICCEQGKKKYKYTEWPRNVRDASSLDGYSSFVTFPTQTTMDPASGIFSFQGHSQGFTGTVRGLSINTS